MFNPFNSNKKELFGVGELIFYFSHVSKSKFFQSFSFRFFTSMLLQNLPLVHNRSCGNTLRKTREPFFWAGVQIKTQNILPGIYIDIYILGMDVIWFIVDIILISFVPFQDNTFSKCICSPLLIQTQNLSNLVWWHSG